MSRVEFPWKKKDLEGLEKEDLEYLLLHEAKALLDRQYFSCLVSVPAVTIFIFIVLVSLAGTSLGSFVLPIGIIAGGLLTYFVDTLMNSTAKTLKQFFKKPSQKEKDNDRKDS